MTRKLTQEPADIEHCVCKAAVDESASTGQTGVNNFKKHYPGIVAPIYKNSWRYLLDSFIGAYAAILREGWDELLEPVRKHKPQAKDDPKTL